MEAKTPDGPFRRTLRITDFYTRQNGAWIQTGSDTDLHPESAARQNQTARKLSDSQRKSLVDAREAVWRAYFGGDRAALEKLPVEQREVVLLKISEQKTFAAIAAELSLPLGTVLTRMQLALAKLRRALGSER